MTTQDQTNYFVRRTFGTLRDLPAAEQRDYLAGLLILVGDDPVVAPLRDLHRQLDQTSSQIEMFALGQLTLKLEPEGPAK